MSEIKLERCPAGHESVIVTTSAGSFVRCTEPACWSGPPEDTGEASAEAWNTAMRAMQAGTQAPQPTGGPSVGAPSILDDRVFARMLDCAALVSFASAVALGDTRNAGVLCDGTDKIVAERVRREQEPK